MTYVHTLKQYQYSVGFVEERRNGAGGLGLAGF